MIDIAIVACLMLSQSSEEAQTFNTKLDFYYFNQFESSVTTGGNVEASSGGTSLRLDSQVTNDDNLMFDFQFQKTDWKFGGTTGLGGDDPWGTVNTIEFVVQWTHKYTDESQWFAAGFVRASYEDGASTDTKAGGSFGLVHSFSSDLTLGLGVGVVGEAQADPRVFPLFVVEWKLTDTLRIRSAMAARFAGRRGLELVWTPQDSWTYGVGLSYEYNRFKLDDSGIAPNGAGETTSYPLVLRATHKASSSCDLTFFGGIVFGGNLEVTDQSRQLIRSTDYESAGVIGIFGQLRF
jgi:hypothetical protein